MDRFIIRRDNYLRTDGITMETLPTSLNFASPSVVGPMQQVIGGGYNQNFALGLHETQVQPQYIMSYGGSNEAVVSGGPLPNNCYTGIGAYPTNYGFISTPEQIQSNLQTTLVYEQRPFSIPDRNVIKNSSCRNDPISFDSRTRITDEPSYKDCRITKTDPQCRGAESELAITSPDAGNSNNTETSTYRQDSNHSHNKLNFGDLRVFSGPVDMVIKWYKHIPDLGLICLFEVVAKLVNIRQGEHSAKHMLVRNDTGPVLQVVYYEIDFLMPDVKTGCVIRVVGKMVGPNKLQAYSVRIATARDVATLSRHAAVSTHGLTKLMASANKP